MTLVVLFAMVSMLAWPHLSDGAPATLAARSRNLDGTELIKIGDLHEVQSHFQEALPYYERAVSAFRQQRNRSGEAIALARMGRVLTKQAKYADALKLLQAAEVLSALLEQQQERARILLDLGMVLEKLSRLEDAQKAYRDSQTLFQRAKQFEGLLESMVRGGALLRTAGKNVEAAVLLEQAVQGARRHHDTVHELAALTVLGDVQARDAVASATATYEEALRLAVAEHDRPAEAALRFKLAGVLEQLERHHDALSMAQKALGLYQSLRDRLREAETLMRLGTLASASGQLPSAIEYHERALSVYRALRDRQGEANTLMALSGLYTAQGAHETADDSRQKAQLLLAPAP